MRVAPLAVQIIVGTVLLVIVWAAVNWIVQVVRKPTEVFVAVSGSLAKVPAQTLAAIRPALRRALHGGHHTGIAGRSGPRGPTIAGAGDAPLPPNVFSAERITHFNAHRFVQECSRDGIRVQTVELMVSS